MARLLTEAYEQGGSLSMRGLSLIMCYDHFLEKKDPVQVARETDHSPDAVGKYCQQFNKVKWCVENEIGKEEIMIITGMKTHLIDEYLKIIEEHKSALPP